jgi:drug/metabolite transporter (DMT)-like permease
MILALALMLSFGVLSVAVGVDAEGWLGHLLIFLGAFLLGVYHALTHPRRRDA